MPLPDESPRGSIANLINRFENQTKRASQSALSASSRSSSVVSHTSSVGDAQKEEAKDRREWPPKTFAQQSEKPGFVMPSYLRPNVNTLASTVASSLAATSSPPAGGRAGEGTAKDPEASADTPKNETPNGGTPVPPPLAPTKSNSSSTSDSQTKAKASMTPVDTKLQNIQVAAEEVEPETPKPGALQRKGSALTVGTAGAGVKPSGKTPATAKPPATARPAAAAPKTPAKQAPSSFKAAPASTRQSLTPAAQPLKPQHTGGSVASTASTTRKPALKPTPATPSRAKTPSKPPATPAARTKSPVARSKTPSTGLYAPTAASLARSRNAPPVPQASSVKKVLSSEAAERLSKPTAASLSKARIPPVTASPRPSIGVTPIKKAATSAPASKATSLKKVASSPAVKKTTSSVAPTKGKATAAAVGGAGVAAAAAATKDEGAPPAEEPHLDEPAEGSAGTPEGASSEEPAVTEQEPEEPESTNEAEEEGSAEPQEPEPVSSNGVKVGGDLEDLVNMLEFVPPSKLLASGEENGSAKIVRPEDVTGEIPDEE